VSRPDIIFVQKHWLTPDTYNKLYDLSDYYFSYDSSAMYICVTPAPLLRRPFDRTARLIDTKLSPCPTNIKCSDRLNVIKTANSLLINAYMPCFSTDQQFLYYNDILQELQSIVTANSRLHSVLDEDFEIGLNEDSVLAAPSTVL
jgi:hypothetical protein